jgi:hypothetical protein
MKDLTAVPVISQQWPVDPSGRWAGPSCCMLPGLAWPGLALPAAGLLCHHAGSSQQHALTPPSPPHTHPAGTRACRTSCPSPTRSHLWAASTSPSWCAAPTAPARSTSSWSRAATTTCGRWAGGWRVAGAGAGWCWPGQKTPPQPPNPQDPNPQNLCTPQDAVMQQFFGLVNSLLAGDAAAARRSLRMVGGFRGGVAAPVALAALAARHRLAPRCAALEAAGPCLRPPRTRGPALSLRRRPAGHLQGGPLQPGRWAGAVGGEHHPHDRVPAGAGQERWRAAEARHLPPSRLPLGAGCAAPPRPRRKSLWSGDGCCPASHRATQPPSLHGGSYLLNPTC